MRPTPPGECRQCWAHAYNKDIHRRLPPGTDCGPCLDHMHNGCPPEMIVPKREGNWW